MNHEVRTNKYDYYNYDKWNNPVIFLENDVSYEILEMLTIKEANSNGELTGREHSRIITGIVSDSIEGIEKGYTMLYLGHKTNPNNGCIKTAIAESLGIRCK